MNRRPDRDLETAPLAYRIHQALTLDSKEEFVVLRNHARVHRTETDRITFWDDFLSP
jgi:hypothetical protein